MAHTNINYAIPIVLNAMGTISAADGWDYVTVPFECIAWQFSLLIGNLGTTSGNNDVVVELDGTDMWTIGTGIGRIAYNASAKYLEWDWENAGMTGYASGQLYPPSGCRIGAGSTLKLNVNAVAGGGTPGDVKLIIWVKPVVD